MLGQTLAVTEESTPPGNGTYACFPGAVERNVMGGVEPERPFDLRGIEHIRPYALNGTSG